MARLTENIKISINPQDRQHCTGCIYLSSENIPYCDLYREHLGDDWEFKRCQQCLEDFGEGEKDENPR